MNKKILLKYQPKDRERKIVPKLLPYCDSITHSIALQRWLTRQVDNNIRRSFARPSNNRITLIPVRNIDHKICYAITNCI